MKKLIATIIFLMLPLFVSAQNSQTFSGKPTYPNKLLPYQFSMELKPGTAGTETITISNNSDKTSTYILSGVDSNINEKGETNFRLGTDAQSDAGAWIGIQSSIEVPAKSEKQIDFTVNAPKDAAKKDYLAGISVESKGVNVVQKDGQNISVNLRNVLKVNIKVTDTPQPVEKAPNPLLTPTNIYLGISVLLFVGVCIFLVVTQLGKKHKSKKAN